MNFKGFRKRAYMLQRYFQDASKTLPRPSKCPQDAPKMPPRCPQGGPRSPQDASKSPQEGSRHPQDPPRYPPRPPNLFTYPVILSNSQIQGGGSNLVQPQGSPEGARRVQKSGQRANIRIQRVWTPSKTAPEAIKIRVWRLRGAKSGPSRAPAPNKS